MRSRTWFEKEKTPDTFRRKAIIMDPIVYFHSNPVPQRAHKKSSNGCQACRVRKVKCSEEKPICQRCQIHFDNIISCDYDTPRLRKKRGPRKAAQNATSETVKIKPKQLLPEVPSQAIDILDGLSELSVRWPTPMCSREASSKPDCCTCPCHDPKYTKLLLDSVFGICRICGDLPNPWSHASDCSPVMSDAVLIAGKVDPFSVLLANTPRVHVLMHHWTTTLALFPTRIHSQYCNNPTWLSAAIANPTLFNTTLYVASVHDAGLHGCRETAESLFYKAQTIRVLNETLRDPAQAVSDETIAAVLLLTHIVSIIGHPDEVETHLNGLRQMITLRGGIKLMGVPNAFLRMIGTTNHLTAVISEAQALQPMSPPYTPTAYPGTSESSDSMYESPQLKPFALLTGFHSMVVNILFEMGCLYAVLDAFTSKLLPQRRQEFEDLVEGIEMMSIIGEAGQNEVA